jgi:hypothetical protein
LSRKIGDLNNIVKIISLSICQLDLPHAQDKASVVSYLPQAGTSSHGIRDTVSREEKWVWGRNFVRG